MNKNLPEDELRCPGACHHRATCGGGAGVRKRRLTAPGLIQPVGRLDEGPQVFRLIEHEPDKVIKFAVRF